MTGYSQVDFPLSWENHFAFLKTLGVAFKPLPALIGGSREIVILVLLTAVVKWAPNTMEIVQKQRYNWFWVIAISLILCLSLSHVGFPLFSILTRLYRTQRGSLYCIVKDIGRRLWLLH
jgi:hypothetical protein